MDGHQQRGGGRERLFLHSDLSVRLISDMSFEKENVYEIVNKIQTNAKNTLISCIMYRKPSSDVVKLFYAKLQKILNSIGNRKNVYMIGDYDIDVLNDMNSEFTWFSSKHR